MRLITVDGVFLIALHRYAAFLFHLQHVAALVNFHRATALFQGDGFVALFDGAGAIVFDAVNFIVANRGVTVVQYVELEVLLRLHRQQLGIFFVVEAQFVEAFFAAGFNTGLGLIRR